MNSIKLLGIISISGIISFSACKSSKNTTKSNETASSASTCSDPNITYNKGLKPILDKNCNTSGCHDASFKQMDFTKYAVLKKFADEGEVKKHVLKIKNMPPNHKLTEGELNAFQCWLDNGAKE